MADQGGEGEAPKIIVDTDWKSQAQAEKERLAEEQKASAAPQGEQGELSPFEEILRLLTTQSLLFLGAFPDPQSGKSVVSLEMASVYIDMIGWLEEKTKGNLSEEESSLLSRTLNELRMEFAEMSKAVAKAVAEGRATTMPMGGGGGPASGGAGPGSAGPGGAGPQGSGGPAGGSPA